MSTKNVTIQLLIVSLLLSVVIAANAKSKTAKTATAKKAPQMVAANASNVKLSTDIQFDGVDVSGRRQSPFGASAVVENEKETPNLIDYRSNYDDRILRSKSGR